MGGCGAGGGGEGTAADGAETAAEEQAAVADLGGERDIETASGAG